MISAGERGRVAGIGPADAHAAVATGIEKSAHFAAGVTDDQHGIFTHVSGDEVAGVRDLGLVGEVEPRPREHLLQFLFVDIAVDVDAAVDEAALSVCQLFEAHHGATSSA